MPLSIPRTLPFSYTFSPRNMQSLNIVITLNSLEHLFCAMVCISSLELADKKRRQKRRQVPTREAEKIPEDLDAVSPQLQTGYCPLRSIILISPIWQPDLICPLPLFNCDTSHITRKTSWLRQRKAET